MLTTATPLLLKLRAGVAVGALALALSACGGTKWGFPYKADIQQGSWITSEQVARLEKGMTREQVRFILGTPALQDIFRTNRWDYTYYNKPGYGKEEERQFTVWFEGDALARWEGDKQPDRQPFQKIDNGAAAPASAGNDKEAPATEQPAAPDNRTGVEINAAGTGNATPPNETSPQPLR